MHILNNPKTMPGISGGRGIKIECHPVFFGNQRQYVDVCLVGHTMK